MGRRMGSGGTRVVRALPSVTDLYEVDGHVLPGFLVATGPGSVLDYLGDL